MPLAPPLPSSRGDCRSCGEDCFSCWLLEKSGDLDGDLFVWRFCVTFSFGGWLLLVSSCDDEVKEVDDDDDSLVGEAADWVLLVSGVTGVLVLLSTTFGGRKASDAKRVSSNSAREARGEKRMLCVFRA